MRFMLIRKADAETEAGVLPTPEFMAAMQRYNDKLARAGVFLDGVGLRASSMGAKVKVNGGAPTVTDGPFTETKELIAGYTLTRSGPGRRPSPGHVAGRPSTPTRRSRCANSSNLKTSSARESCP